MHALSLTVAIIATFLTSYASAAEQPVLSELWVLEGLDNPESIALSENEDFFFVSNVNGEAAEKNALGYLSKISRDGEMIDRYWVRDLNAPKGIARNGDTLFVSDIDTLVQVDIETGTITKRIAIDDAGFLNDVTLSIENGVFISDSQRARIYLYQDGVASVWLEDDRLKGVNGLLIDGNRLWTVTMSEGELLSIDMTSKDIVSVAGGMKNADMLAPLPDGGFIVSSWPGVLRYVTPDGETSVLLNTEDQPIYMNDFLLLSDVLYVPNWQPSTVRAFQIAYPD